MSRTTFVMLALIFAATGAALLLAAARRFAARRSFLASSELATGRVTGFRVQREGGRERDSYFPQIEFTTHAGDAVRFESEVGSESPAREVGDGVRVRYRVDRPHDAELDDFFSLWGLTLLLGGLGAILSLVGAGLLSGWIQP